MPPFEGPKMFECITLYPSKTLIEPSSIEIGSETMIFLTEDFKTL